MAFELPNLPFAPDALEPFMSAKTFEFHHGKHHKAYITNLNNLIKDSDLSSKTLEQIITASAQDAAQAGIFNNAAQVWNHTFFWSCLTPNGGGAIPDGAFKELVAKTFTSEEKFKEEFKNAAVTQFGSGWAWLVLEKGALKIVKTSNADTPIAHNQVPLMTLDVWEHAYYLDYQNRRPDFAQTFLDKLVNWNFVATNFSKAG